MSGGWGTLTNNNPFVINSQLSNAALTLKGPNSTSLTLQAFERNSVARILAEPTVTAVSGEIAKVMVGGEIAVPGPGSCVATNGSNICTPSVVFKPYGVSLNFTPVVQAEGRILIHVGMEVTEIDPSTPSPTAASRCRASRRARTRRRSNFRPAARSPRRVSFSKTSAPPSTACRAC